MNTLQILTLIIALIIVATTISIIVTCYVDSDLMYIFFKMTCVEIIFFLIFLIVIICIKISNNLFF